MIASFSRYIFIILIYMFIFQIIKAMFLDISGVSSKVSLLPTRHAYLVKMGERNNSMTNFLYPLVKKNMILGRAVSADIKVTDRYVSNEHLKLFREGNRWQVEDLESENGTFVNGIKISQPYILDDRDILKIGETEFQFCLNR